MTEHKLTPGSSSCIRRPTLLLVIPAVVIAGALGAWVASGGSLAPTFIAAMFIFLVIILVAVLIGLNEGQRTYSSYRLVESDDALTRTQDGLPPMTIAYADISSIKEYRGQGLRVQGPASTQQLDVPATLENYVLFRQRLNSHHPVETVPARSQWLMLLLTILISIVTVAAVVIFRTSTDRLVIIASGAFLLIGGVVGIIITLRSPQSLRWVKWSSLLLLFPLLSILLRLFSIISGP